MAFPFYVDPNDPLIPFIEAKFWNRIFSQGSGDGAMLGRESTLEFYTGKVNLFDAKIKGLQYQRKKAIIEAWLLWKQRTSDRQYKAHRDRVDAQIAQSKAQARYWQQNAKRQRVERSRFAFDQGYEFNDDEGYDGDGNNEYDYDDGFTERDQEHESDIHDSEPANGVSGQDEVKNAQGYTEQSDQDNVVDDTYNVDSAVNNPFADPDVGPPSDSLNTDTSAGSLIAPPSSRLSLPDLSGPSKSATGAPSNSSSSSSTALAPLSIFTAGSNRPRPPTTTRGRGRPPSSTPRIKIETISSEQKSPTTDVMDILSNFQLSDPATTESLVKGVPKTKKDSRFRQQGQRGVKFTATKNRFPPKSR
jgi:hypothetical protein